MAKSAKKAEADLPKLLTKDNYLFQGMEDGWLAGYLPEGLHVEKLYSNRPIYTAFRPGSFLDVLYLVMAGGPAIVRSTPLDRIIAMTYPGSCFGTSSLPFSHEPACRAFPSLVEAYKTTDVVKLPLDVVKKLYAESEVFRDRYDYLFELQAKFQYHLLNCSTYPPQAVASLLRALIYQERSLANQPNASGVYVFDLSTDLIARACQLNHRTVEQVLKGMQQVGLLESPKSTDHSEDTVRVVDPEGMKEVYGATRDKISWWPLR